jgi:cyclophilin family peptidyl-prolyl cis-trans isomerase
MRLLFSLFLLGISILTSFGQGAASQLGPGEIGVRMEVEGKGDIVFKLFTKEAPKTTAQIIKLVKKGFYDGIRFHRVERQPRPYLAWFGDPAAKAEGLDDPKIGTGGSGMKIPFEPNGRTHIVGAVGLARPKDDKDGGDSQFYFVLGPASFLDGNYTIFGQVVVGLDVMKKLEKGDRVSAVTIIGG